MMTAIDALRAGNCLYLVLVKESRKSSPDPNRRMLIQAALH
jgi:hypothetical protein